MTNLTIELASFTVGDDVSQGFNGDWYPLGKVARFTPSRQFMYTEGGDKLVRRVVKDTRYNKETHDRETFFREVYESVGGTWVVCKGIHQQQNPHF